MPSFFRRMDTEVPSFGAPSSVGSSVRSTLQRRYEAPPSEGGFAFPCQARTSHREAQYFISSYLHYTLSAKQVRYKKYYLAYIIPYIPFFVSFLYPYTCLEEVDALHAPSFGGSRGVQSTPRRGACRV